MTKKKDIILIGGGGHCKAVIDVIESQSKYNILGVVDMPEKLNSEILGYKFIGTDYDIPKLIKDCNNFVITAGQIKSADLRKKLYQYVLDAGGEFSLIVSGKAYVSKYSSIGTGTVIMHDSIVNADAKIGVNCIINNKALIEHDARIGNHTHISTGTVVNGDCKIGDNCFIGSNSIIVHGVSVCDNVVIGAGSVVNKNINNPGVYVGNPAKIVK